MMCFDGVQLATNLCWIMYKLLFNCISFSHHYFQSQYPLSHPIDHYFDIQRPINSLSLLVLFLFIHHNTTSHFTYAARSSSMVCLRPSPSPTSWHLKRIAPPASASVTLLLMSFFARKFSLILFDELIFSEKLLRSLRELFREN